MPDPRGGRYRLEGLDSMRDFEALLGATFLVVVAAIAPPGDASEPEFVESGVASWYGPGFAGRPTASGEIYDPDLLTAAHKTLPLGTLVRVHNLDNDRSMIVRINDRGPFIRGRIIDLSRAGAEVLGFKEVGLANVRIATLAPPRRSGTSTTHSTMIRQAAEIADQALERLLPESQRAKEDAPEAEAHSSEEERNGVYFVQIGAFRDSGHAYDLVDRIAAPSMSWKVDFAGGMYRVLIGPYTSPSQATRAQKDLESAGVPGFLRASR
jgi:rare lipoprotein A